PCYLQALDQEELILRRTAQLVRRLELAAAADLDLHVELAVDERPRIAATGNAGQIPLECLVQVRSELASQLLRGFLEAASRELAETLQAGVVLPSRVGRSRLERFERLVSEEAAQRRCGCVRFLCALALLLCLRDELLERFGGAVEFLLFDTGGGVRLAQSAD